MAKVNTIHTVRFWSVHVLDQNDLGKGTRRSAWKSEHRDQPVDLPPRRPLREQDFLCQILEDLFVDETDDADRDTRQNHSQPPKQKQPRSILKNSKYNTPTMPADTAIISEGNDSSSDEENPTPLSLQKHRDSMFDFQQFVTRYKRTTTTPNHEELKSSLHSLPPMVILDEDDGDDDAESSLLSSGSFSLEMIPEIDDQSLGPFQ